MRNVVTLHRYLKTEEEMTAAAIKVGLNQFLGGGSAASIKQALDDKQLTESDIDAAIKGKYKTILKLGLLDPSGMSPYSKIGAAGEPEPWSTEKDRSVAREVARESIVLLKNAGGLLPLDRKRIKSIAVIGPRAAEVLSDLYTGPMPHTVSLLEGIRDKAGAGITVNYAANNDDGAAVNAAKSSEVVLVVIGNDPVCGGDLKNIGQIFNPQDSSTKPCPVPGEGREGHDRLSIDLPTEELVKQAYAVNPKTVVALISSFPYAINWSQANVPAVLHVTHAAQEQDTAMGDVLFGDYISTPSLAYDRVSRNISIALQSAADAGIQWYADDRVTVPDCGEANESKHQVQADPTYRTDDNLGGDAPGWSSFVRRIRLGEDRYVDWYG
jgi:beta-glucosidase